MRIFNFLIKHRNFKVLFILLKILGVEIPPSVKIGENFSLPHLGGGIVIHPNCKIGNNVEIYQSVTIGRANPWIKNVKTMGKVIIEDNVVLCAGAKIIFDEDNLVIKKNSIVGANAVLNKSTNQGEIWAGIPAKKIGNRE